MRTIPYEAHQRKLGLLSLEKRRSKEGMSDGFRQQKGTRIEAGVFCGPEPKLKQMKGNEKEIPIKYRKILLTIRTDKIYFESVCFVSAKELKKILAKHRDGYYSGISCMGWRLS